MKNLLLILIVACQLISCNSKKKGDDKNSQTSVEKDTINENITDDNLDTTLVFEGTLPCADCSGIETILKIYQGDGTIESHKFELISIYKGKKPESKFTKKGNFNTERGLGTDPDGTIYILNYDKPEAEQVYYGYYSKNPEQIYLLDKNRKIIKSKLDYSLELNQ